MKKVLYCLLFFLVGLFNNYSQSGINTKTPKATLDVQANTSNTDLASGLIAPRVTLNYLIQNALLYTPDLKGTIVYVYDVNEVEFNDDEISTRTILTDGYYYFDGSKWVLFVIPDEVDVPMEPWRVEGSGNEATLNNENIVQNAKVGVGFTDLINSSAQFEIRSTNRGLLIPRMTTNQRDAIVNPANSLMIFNTETTCFNFYKQNKWRSLCGDLGESSISVPNCASAVILGDYKVGTVVNSSNYFQISLNVIEAGNYSILVNNPTSGFFFQKEGTFPNEGIYTLQIPAIGAPSTPGSNAFTIQINDEVIICTSFVNVLPANVQFNNIQFVSADQLTKGQSSMGKTIVIKVDVINPGTFNFQTNSQNGVAYSAENVELGVGVGQEVILYSNGNPPISSGNIVYAVSGSGYVGSQFNVTVNVIESVAQITSINCSSIISNDILRLDTALTPSNYLDIPVTTNSTGTYVVNVTSADNPGFNFTGSGNITSVGTSIIRVYGTGTPTKAGRISFVVDINGSTCNLELTVVIPTKSVLLVGTNSSYIRNALNNASNFGPNGTSKIESINLLTQGNSMNATQLTNAINNQGVQVILIGWGWNPNAECISILSNFIKNKKGFVYWVESQSDQNYIKPLLDQTFNANVSLTSDSYSVYTAKVSNTVPSTNPYLNGVFGNASGKYFRADDAASWLGVVPSTMPSNLNYLVHMPSNGGSGTGSNSERYTEIYGEGFFMFSDWGFLNHNSSAYGSNTPIGFSTSATNANSTDGTSVTNTSVASGQVANWVIFGNAMDYIFNYVQQNFNPNESL